mgnify:CR=1 FL=1
MRQAGARHPGDGGDLDALVGQRFGLFGRGLAVDRALFDVATMDLADLVGESGADIVAAFLDFGAQPLEHAAKLRRHARVGRRLHGGGGGGFVGHRFGRLLTGAAGQARRHHGAFHPAVAADRALDEATFGLTVERAAVLEPAIELMLRGATQLVVHHAIIRPRPEVSSDLQ